MNANQQTKAQFNQNQDTILGTHAKALHQSSTKFCSSITQLNDNAKATQDMSAVLKEILKEMQDSTQDLINNLSEFKKECLTH
jgi:uncharacterized protein (DUF1810 family)